MIVIDFTKKNKLLTESWMRAMADWNKTFLKYIYGKDVTMTADLTAHKKLFEEDEDGQSLKFVIRGEVEDVKAYSKAIMAEKYSLLAKFTKSSFSSNSPLIKVVIFCFQKS